MTKVEIIVEECECEIKYAKKALDKFAAQFAESPGAALEWSSAVFISAARIEVATMVREYLVGCPETDESTKIERITKHLRDEILRKAKYPERSTSQQSNLMKQEVLAAEARMLETIEGIR